MKITTNLPGNLRAFFGILRFLSILGSAVWLLPLTFNSWIQNRFIDEPKLIITVGEVSLPGGPKAFGLSADTKAPGSLVIHELRGSLQMNLCSKDAALVSALRWTVIPEIVVGLAFAWVIFGSLRNLCANFERGEVLSEKNLRLVRGVGVALLVLSLISFGIGVWATHVMDGYLRDHVTLTGMTGALHFNMPPGSLSPTAALVTGCLVLVLSEAFRQGLSLKAESDLIV